MKDLINKATQTAQAGIDSASSIFADLPIIGDYRDKERRREADRRLRESIAVALESARKRVVEIERSLLNKGKLPDLPRVDMAATKLQNLIDRIRTAPSGYAGFFAAEKIREPELEKLRQFDERIAASVPAIDEDIERMEQAVEAGEDYTPALKDLLNNLGELDERLDHRKEAIRAAGAETGALPEASAVVDEGDEALNEENTVSE
jgi:DNA repair exonuclease SbcCD ATPase subunit